MAEGTKDGRISYQSGIPHERFLQAQRIELARQDLCAGRATKAALNYARFLVVVEEDATINGRHQADKDAAVLRKWPFLSELL